jgi:hypothetical protein
LKQETKRFNISTDKKKSNRQDIPQPEADAMADAWQKGKHNVRQFLITNQTDSALHKHQLLHK